ncbi:MAG: hypothetical protein ACE14O_02000 [Candidatus Cloacimonadaceae bacterium]
MKKIIPFLVLMILGGCDIFSLRESEKPSSPAAWNYFYTDWRLTVQNLQYAYEDERNVARYSELFMPDFRFYFSAQDINDYNINTVWGRDNERDMLYNLSSSEDTDSVIVSLNPIPNQVDDTLSVPVKLYREYNLKLVKKGNAPAYYSGKMELQLVQDHGFWRIQKWYDYRSEVYPTRHTWGKLKYDYSV